MDVEYTICQIQSGQISLAAKTHRQRGGNPVLRILITSSDVTWILDNLIDGSPETIVGVPRQNHIDFYFLWDNLASIKAGFPRTSIRPNPSLKLPTKDPFGTQRPGGKFVPILAPVVRYQLDSVDLFVAQQPSFEATGNDPFLNMDVESAPKSLYGGRDTFEIHFGIQADFVLVGQYNGAVSTIRFTMSLPTYACIYSDIQALR